MDPHTETLHSACDYTIFSWKKHDTSANATAFWRVLIFVAKWDMIWEFLSDWDTKETKMDIDQIAQLKKNGMIQTMQAARDL